MVKNRTVVLDVREDIRSGHSPCAKIMAAAEQLNLGEQLLLIAPFQPTPLFELMGDRGFDSEPRAIGAGDWEVRFTRRTEAGATIVPVAAKQGATSACPSCSSQEVVDVDARGLEPPEPMMRILTALSQLAPGEALRAQTDRRPIHLYPHLAKRGFCGETKEAADGSYLTFIRRG